MSKNIEYIIINTYRERHFNVGPGTYSLPCNLMSRCIQDSAAYKAYRINWCWFSCKSEWMEHKPNLLRNDTWPCQFRSILVSKSIPDHFLSITTGRCTYFVIIKFSGDKWRDSQLGCCVGVQRKCMYSKYVQQLVV